MKSVYLAGPITGRSYAAASFWRDKVAKELAGDFECLDPLRWFTPPEDFDRYAPLPGDFDGGVAAVHRDLKDIRDCNVVLVNLGHGGPSIGTLCELGYASAVKDHDESGSLTRWPLIAVVDWDLPEYEHVFVRELADKRFGTLSSAIAWLREVVA